MAPLALVAACLAPGLPARAAATPPPAAGSVVVGNADNAVALQAGAAAPRVLRLTHAGAAAWSIGGIEPLIDHAIVGGADVALQWRFDRASSRSGGAAAAFVYRSREPALRLSWEWRARSRHGPLEHVIRIENRSGREIWLPLQQSLRLDFRVAADEALEQLWIDKGAGEAPAVGTHRVAVGEGYAWRGTSTTFAHPRGDAPREIIPYTFVRTTGERPAGWYAGVEFSGRIALRLSRDGGALVAEAGLDPEPGPFRTRLPANGSFVTPTAFLGAGGGDADAAGNTLRRWVREALGDPRTLRDPDYPLLTNNSWGSAMTIADAQARRMIDDAQALGFEMFHMDAGWFRAVGDWRPDPQKFPHGIAAVADYAHARGMRFGLWVDWAQAGTSTQPGALNVADRMVRDWLTTDPPPGWKPAEFKGITIDVGVPAAQAWASREVERIVRDYHVDMLEHDGYVVAQTCDRDDHPHAPPTPATSRYSDDEFLWVDSGNSTDVSYHATRAYYAIHDALKRAHPGLLLEVCNDGGRMVDFGSAAHGDYFSIVDSYDPLSNRRAFYDASHVLPPAMLEAYVKEWPAPRLENFRYMLRSGMMGWLTVMIDTTTWSAERHAVAAAELRRYKDVLRPLIRGADLYHVAPRADGKGWDGVEYFDATRGRGVLYAFRGTNRDEGTHTFALKGLQPRRRYRLHFVDGSASDATRRGSELMAAGVTVSLPLTESSELVMIAAE